MTDIISNKHLAVIGLCVWALVGVPLAFFLYTEWSYSYALSRGKLPFLGPSEWLWYVGFGICLITGLASVVRLSVLRSKRLWLLSLIGAGYLLLMGVALVAIGFFVACHNGDCI